MFPSHVNLDIVLRIVGHSSLSKCESNVKVSKQQRQSASARPGLAGCIRAAGKNPQGFVRTRNGMDLTQKSNKLTHANNLFLQRLRLCFTPHLVQDGPKEPKPPVGAYQIFVQEEVLGDV